MNLVYFKLVLVMFFWGTAFVSGRILTQSYHPFSVAFIRFLLASLILLPLLIKRNPYFFKITWRQWLKVLFLVATGVFAYNYFFFNGLKLIEAGRSSIIISMNPAITAIGAIFLLDEKLTNKKIWGFILALTGAFVVISRGKISILLHGGFGIGELYMLGAVLSWVSYTLFGKVALTKITPYEATTWSALIGACMLLPFALEHQLSAVFEQADIWNWMHLLNLGVFFICFGFIWYYEGIKEIGASRASSFISLVPIFGTACGVIFLGEELSPPILLGGAIVIYGVYLVNRKS